MKIKIVDRLSWIDVDCRMIRPETWVLLKRNPVYIDTSDLGEHFCCPTSILDEMGTIARKEMGKGILKELKALKKLQDKYDAAYVRIII